MQIALEYYSHLFTKTTAEPLHRLRSCTPHHAANRASCRKCIALEWARFASVSTCCSGSTPSRHSASTVIVSGTLHATAGAPPSAATVLVHMPLPPVSVPRSKPVQILHSASTSLFVALCVANPTDPHPLSVSYVKGYSLVAHRGIRNQATCSLFLPPVELTPLDSSPQCSHTPFLFYSTYPWLLPTVSRHLIVSPFRASPLIRVPSRLHSSDPFTPLTLHHHRVTHLTGIQPIIGLPHVVAVCT